MTCHRKKPAVTPIVQNLQGKSMQIQSRFLNDKARLARNLSVSASVAAGKTVLTAMLIAVALAACGKTDNKMTTADRVKLVEEKQKIDPDFYLQKKAGQTSPATLAPAAPVPTTVQAPPSTDSAKM